MGVFAGLLFTAFLTAFYRYILTQRILKADKKIMNNLTLDGAGIGILNSSDDSGSGGSGGAGGGGGSHGPIRRPNTTELEERINSLSGFSDLKNAARECYQIGEWKVKSGNYLFLKNEHELFKKK